MALLCNTTLCTIVVHLYYYSLLLSIKATYVTLIVFWQFTFEETAFEYMQRNNIIMMIVLWDSCCCLWLIHWFRMVLCMMLLCVCDSVYIICVLSDMVSVPTWMSTAFSPYSFHCSYVYVCVSRSLLPSSCYNNNIIILFVWPSSSVSVFICVSLCVCLWVEGVESVYTGSTACV